MSKKRIFKKALICKKMKAKVMLCFLPLSAAVALLVVCFGGGLLFTEKGEDAHPRLLIHPRLEATL